LDDYTPEQDLRGLIDKTMAKKSSADQADAVYL